MAEKTQEQLVQETHQGMFGVPGTEDKGLVGDVREIKREVKATNSRVAKLENKQRYMWGVMVGAAGLGGGMGVGIGKLFGG